MVVPTYSTILDSMLYTSPPVRKQHPRSETISEPNKPTFLTICLMAVLQPSGYSIMEDGDTPIQLGLP